MACPHFCWTNVIPVRCHKFHKSHDVHAMSLNAQLILWCCLYFKSFFLSTVFLDLSPGLRGVVVVPAFPILRVPYCPMKSRIVPFCPSTLFPVCSCTFLPVIVSTGRSALFFPSLVIIPLQLVKYTVYL